MGSLQLILGRAGSGKTREIRRRITNKIKSGESGIILLVPEQSSFDSERGLLTFLDESEASKVEVLNFSRLISETGRLYGGFAGRRIDDSGRAVLMDLAIRDIRDLLPLYGRYAGSPEFARAMLACVAEFKQCAVTPEDLAKTADESGNPSFSDKIREISLIMGAYETLVADNFLDSHDDLTRLYNQLAEHKYFTNKTVYLDSFKGFTAQQMKIISRICEQADALCVTLTADNLDGNDYSIFANVRETARDILREAKKAGMSAAPPVYLEPGRRFENNSLLVLEAAVFRGEGVQQTAPAPEIILTAAQTARDEIEHAAVEIRRLVREDGLRFREIALIAREISAYEKDISAVFPKYGIPFFVDRRDDISGQPIVRFLLSAGNAALSKYNSDQIFEYLKTGLAGLDNNEIAILENYRYVWNIRGEEWLSPWTNDPAGFSGKPLDDQKREQLQKINNLRIRAVTPIINLKSRFDTTVPRRILTSLFKLLEETNTADSLMRLSAELNKSGEILAAETVRKSWDIVVSAFDQLALLLENREVSPRRLLQMLEIVLNTADTGSAPPEIDEVAAGSAHRMRPAAPRAVFIIGANENIFPATAPAAGLLTAAERSELISRGLPVTDNTEGFIIDERFLAYMSLTSPSQRLYVTWHTSDKNGRTALPSEIIYEIKELFPGITQSEFPFEPLKMTESKLPAYELLARGYKFPTVFESSLLDYLKSGEEGEFFLRRLKKAGKKPENITPRSAQMLYEKDINISPSRIETFYKCPFSYFCRYGLKINPLRPAQMDVLERGTLSHLVLEKIFSNNKELTSLTREEIDENVRKILSEYTENVLGGVKNKSQKFIYTIKRIGIMLTELIIHIQKEFSESEFSPEYFELNIGKEISANPLPLPGGGTISIRGSVDRADLWRDADKTYLRVVDYKSGKKSFRMYDVLYGQNLQMLIYLFALCEAGEQLLGGEITPAGVLYLPVRRAVSTGTAGIPGESENDEKLEEKLTKQLQMSGIVLDDVNVLKAMDPELKGNYIPAKIKNDGTLYKDSSVINQNQLSQLRRHINKMLIDMGVRVTSGDTSRTPLDGSKGACEYCDFSAICKKEPDEVNPEIPAISAEEAFNILNEEYGSSKEQEDCLIASKGGL